MIFRQCGKCLLHGSRESIMVLFQSVLLALLVLLLIAGGFLIYVYRWLLTRPVPDIQGKMNLSCLDGKVTVKRDRHGIPHINAESEADLFRAQGYVHAQDRMWQMEQTRRIVRGTLSEIFGEAALPADRYIRTLGIWRSAERETSLLWDEEIEILNWYCQGINEYMRQRKGKLAAEFRLLQFEPEPWTPTDCLGLAKFVGWTMSLNWEKELIRFLLLKKLGPDKVADLEDRSGLHAQAIVNPLPPEMDAQILKTTEMLLAELERVREFIPQVAGGQGSNCWVVSTKHTKLGYTMLCNDPHMQVSIPCSLYEQHLTCPDLNAIGAIFPGTPGVIFGHNEHLAWGITNACTDVQDLYFEKTHPDRPGQYETEAGWQKFQVHSEKIQIKGREEPMVMTIRETRHGPIVSDLIADLEEGPISLRWTGHDPGHTIHCIRTLLQARSCQEGEAAFREWITPSLNLSFADTAHNISYALVGRHPVRSSGLGLVPNAGWTGAGEWTSFVPYEELPSCHNPDNGYLVHANNRLTSHEGDHWYGCDFDLSFRANRILSQLQEFRSPSFVEMCRLQQDTFSGLAKELVPELIRYEFHDPWERHAQQTLARWDFRMDVGGEEGLIFHYIANTLLHEAFSSPLGELKDRYLGQSYSPLARDTDDRIGALACILQWLQTRDSSDWYGMDAQGRPRNREDFVRTAVGKAVSQIRSEMGEASRKWAWGRIHQIRFVHIMGSVWILKPLINRGPFPLGGDGTSPMLASAPMGTAHGLVFVAPTYRAVMEVGNWDSMESVISTGQSGHPVSRMYDDQIGMWREGAYHAMPFTPEAIDEVTKFVLYLEPEGTTA